MSHCSGDHPGPKAVGGFGESRAPTEEDHAVADKVKGEYIRKTGQNPSKFEVVRVRSQVVAGTNYIFKVKIGDNSYVHIKVFEPLPHTNEEPSLVSYQLNKKKDDKLENFEDGDENDK